MKLKVAPGAFDNVPEDEQQELFDELEKMVEDGSIFENSTPVDMSELETEDPELFALLNARIDKIQ